MDNLNRNEGDVSVGNDKTTNATAPRYRASASVAAISREKLVVLIAMLAFALVLFSVVLVVTLVGNKGGYDMSGGNGGLGGLDNVGDSGKDHNHSYAFEMELVDGKFNLLAKCNGGDGCDKPEYKVEDVQGVTVSETVPASCAEEGRVVYSLSMDGKTITYTEKTNALGHKINGVNASELVNADGYLVYDGVNVVISDGVQLACNKGYAEGGFYKCGVCAANVAAPVFVPHIAGDTNNADNWVTVKPATCTEDGKAVARCKLCNAESAAERVIPALGHKINGTDLSEFKGENGYLVYDKVNVSALPGMDLTCNTVYDEGGIFRCSTCQSQISTSFFVAHASKDSAVSSNWVIRTGDEATCKKKGREVLLCKCGAEVKEEREIPKLMHKINGVDVSEFKNENGTLIYDSSYVKLFGSEEPAISGIKCNTTYKEGGYYICSSCNVPIETPFFVPHVSKDAADDSNWVIPDGGAPTCTESGRKIICCKFCDVEVMDEQTIEPLGHSYVDSLTVDGDIINLVTACVNGCGDVTTADVTDEVVEIRHKDANCGSPEETEYAYYYEDDRDALTVIKIGEKANKVHVFDYSSKREDGTYDYLPGVTLPIDPESIECGGTSRGFVLKCTMCEVGISGIITVHVPEHEYVVTDILRYPTFGKVGYVNLKCTNSDWGCTHEAREVEISKLDHLNEKNVVLNTAKSDENYYVFDYTTTVEIEGVEAVIKLEIEVHVDDVPPSLRPKNS